MSSQKPFIISVTGAHSSVGKTSLCTILLKELKGFGAIKFTKTSLYTALIDDINILNREGKDTALFLESGAQRVIWIQSPYRKLKGVLDVAVSRMRDLQGFIVEGNSPVDFLNSHLIIFIIGSKGEIKPSASGISKRADIVVVNSSKKPETLPFLSTLGRKGRKVFWIDLIEKKGEINEFFSCVKEEVNKGPHSKNGNQ
jgi:molybdopterin-guanine dinucleotide biosynthesis protein